MVQYRNLRPQQRLFSTPDYRRQLSSAIREATQQDDIQMVRILQKESGLLPSTASRTVYVPEFGELDYGIAPVIVWLNQRRIQTLSSCSGLSEDHEGVEKPGLSGYIIFADHPIADAWISLVCKQREELFLPALTYFQGVPSLTLFFGRKGLLFMLQGIEIQTEVYLAQL